MTIYRPRLCIESYLDCDSDRGAVLAKGRNLMKKLNVALVGLGFGGAFAAIYKEHPLVGELTLCDPNADRLKQANDFIGGAKRVNTLEEVLADPSVDAVHLATPIWCTSSS